MTRDPRERPISVMGLTPRWRSMRTPARTLPAALARSSALFQGLSIKYPSFVRTARGEMSYKNRSEGAKARVLIGHCRAVMRAVMAVAASTVCPS
jgi:hypothetical protein